MPLILWGIDPMTGFNKKLLSACAVFAALCLGISACAPQEGAQTEKECRVVLAESAYYTCDENIKTVSRGSDAAFTLDFVSGYTFKDASYDDYSADVRSAEGGGTEVVLTLKNVRYFAFVSVGVEETEKTYEVSVAGSSVFRCEEPRQIVRAGGDAVFTLWFGEGYTFDSLVDYAGSYRVTGIDGAVNENRERRVVLTVENVTEDLLITVKERALPSGPSEGETPPGEEIELQPVSGYAVVGYALNGGRFLREGNDGSYYTINYSLFHYRRPNTSLGTDTIAREGYIQTGWNTKADGSGTHVGLGSRADVVKGETLLLYAEWAEQTDAALFDYVTIDEEDIPALYREKERKTEKLQELVQGADSADRCAVVTGYRGTDAETLVIPETLGGVPTAVVASGAVSGDRKIGTVVFPLSMQYIMDDAFLYCEELTEIYLYDSISYIDDRAFGTRNVPDARRGEHIETLHINAKEMPIFGENESAQFANKMEMLIEHEHDEKTVIFGSCSIWYGLYAERFGEATGRLAFNMGVEGETCTLVQLDIIKQYMHGGDTLIYICDIGSPYLLGYDVDFDARVYRMFEFNYDLLASTDMRRYSNIFGALTEYLTIKNNSFAIGVSGSYEDYLYYITEYGDNSNFRQGTGHNGAYAFYSPEVLEENRALEKTEEFLQGFADMGIDLYYGFGMLSDWVLEYIPEAEETIADLNAYFPEKFAELNMPATMIGDIYFGILPNDYFTEYVFRVNSYGQEYYTQKFIECFLGLV